MGTITSIAFYLGVIAYSAAATLYFVELARRDASSLFARWAPRVLGIGALLHSGHVVAASFFTQVCPVESVHFVLSLSALIATAAYLFLRTRYRVHAMGVVVAPLSLAFLIGAQFVGTASPDASVPRPLLALHVTANLLGVGVFLLAGAAATFYLFEERRLRAKRINWLTARLPPLDALERAEHRLLLVGFPLLTLGIVTGAIFGGQLFSADGAQLTRALLAYAAWMMVAAVLILRALAGWRGRRAAYGTVAGAVCILLVILLYVVQPSMGAGS
jgi:ABC-type uncharacterized transport system permease subunit